jgi:hypothetical protein
MDAVDLLLQIISLQAFVSSSSPSQSPIWPLCANTIRLQRDRPALFGHPFIHRLQSTLSSLTP